MRFHVGLGTWVYGHVPSGFQLEAGPHDLHSDLLIPQKTTELAWTRAPNRRDVHRRAVTPGPIHRAPAKPRRWRGQEVKWLWGRKVEIISVRKSRS